MKNHKSFVKTYKWILLVTMLLVIVGFIVIYFIFKGKGLIPAGINLQRRDWLAFVGGYLSFAGTLCVSIITVLQTTYYNDKEDYKQAKERINKIRPIFAVDFSGLCKDEEEFKITISNVGEFPISNVAVNGHYLYQLLPTGKEKEIVFSYSNSEKHKLLESEYEKSENGYPKNIIINYEDIDGNSMFQIFEMKLFEGAYYYSLEAIEKVL